MIFIVSKIQIVSILGAMTPKDALNEAIRIAGGITAFTELVGAPTVGSVKAWRKSGIPPAYCPTIERVTGVPSELTNPSVEWNVIRGNNLKKIARVIAAMYASQPEKPQSMNL